MDSLPTKVAPGDRDFHFYVWDQNRKSQADYDRATMYDPTKTIMMSRDGGKHWCMAKLDEIQRLEKFMFPPVTTFRRDS